MPPRRARGRPLHPIYAHNEQVRILQTLERLQLTHIQVLRAILQEPDPNSNLYVGSPLHVLSRRLPEMSREQMEELVQQLNGPTIIEYLVDAIETSYPASTRDPAPLVRQQYN